MWELRGLRQRQPRADGQVSHAQHVSPRLGGSRREQLPGGDRWLTEDKHAAPIDHGRVVVAGGWRGPCREGPGQEAGGQGAVGVCTGQP